MKTLYFSLVVVFGAFFQLTSSQSDQCIGYCGAGTANGLTCPTGYRCFSDVADPSCCPIAPERCIDHDIRCGGWAANGFCNSPFWTVANRMACKKSCGLCTPPANPSCKDQNVTMVTVSVVDPNNRNVQHTRNHTLCEIWARNGFCQSNKFYSGYIQRTCNFSCGCTPILPPPSICARLFGRAADLFAIDPLNPGACAAPNIPVPGGAANAHCCAVPNLTNLKCADVYGKVLGPASGTCPAGSIQIDDECCITRIPITGNLFGIPTPNSCTKNSDCTTPPGICIGGFCWAV